MIWEYVFFFVGAVIRTDVIIIEAEENIWCGNKNYFSMRGNIKRYFQ